MLKFVARILIILFMVYIANAENSDADVPAINEDLPLIIIKGEYDKLGLPNDVEIRRKLFRKKKIQFTWSLYDKQVFYCPAETEKQKRKIETANKISKAGEKFDNCLFKTKKSKKTTTRFPKCEKQPEPRLMKEFETKETKGNDETASKTEPVLCGADNKGQNLIFGYAICEEYKGIMQKIEYKFSDKKRILPFSVRSVSMYEICYNIAKKEILYTSHSIMSPLLLKKDLLKIERSKPPAVTMATNKLKLMPDTDFEEVKSEFEEIEKSNKFKIQMLVPLEDFPFVVWKRPVYHYVNTSLIHEELQSCWNHIHDIIRNDAIQTTRKLNIFTKAFRYSETPSGKKRNYKEETKIISSVWVKFVHFRSIYSTKNKSVAIIANNYRDVTTRKIISEDFECESNLCWRVTKYECNGLGRDIHCCKVNGEIKQLFGLTSDFETDLLDIDDLIEDVPDSTTLLQRLKTSPG